MEITHLVIYALAVWRISSLFVNESGPWGIFVKARAWTGILHNDKGIAYQIPDNFLAGVLSCVWCCSIWVSLFMAIVWFVSPSLALKIAVPFALSAGAIAVDGIINKDVHSVPQR